MDLFGRRNLVSFLLSSAFLLLEGDLGLGCLDQLVGEASDPRYTLALLRLIAIALGLLRPVSLSRRQGFHNSVNAGRVIDPR